MDMNSYSQEKENGTKCTNAEKIYLLAFIRMQGGIDNPIVVDDNPILNKLGEAEIMFSV